MTIVRKKKEESSTALPDILKNDVDTLIGIELETALDSEQGTRLFLSKADYERASREYIPDLKYGVPSDGVESTSTIRYPYKRHMLQDKDYIFKVGKDISDIYGHLLCNPITEDGGGIELRFNPYTYDKYLKVMSTIDEVLRYLITAKFRIAGAHTAGIHIHIDRKAFKLETFKNIVKFINNNKMFMLSFSKRQSTVNTYSCIYPGQIPETLNEENFYTEKDTNQGIRFNENGKGTLEFRLFGSTLDPVIFHSFVEFLLALKGFAEVGKKVDNLQAFISFVGEHCGNFKNLVTRLEELQLTSPKQIVYA